VLKETAATATLAACIVAVLILIAPLVGHAPFDTLSSHLSAENLLDRWIR